MAPALLASMMESWLEVSHPAQMFMTTVVNPRIENDRKFLCLQQSIILYRMSMHAQDPKAAYTKRLLLPHTAHVFFVLLVTRLDCPRHCFIGNVMPGTVTVATAVFDATLHLKAFVVHAGHGAKGLVQSE